MNILITGGAGFIGSNFVQYFHAKYPNYNFVNVDILSHGGNRDFVAHLESESNYSFVQADVADYEAMDELFAKYEIDAVIHFAAETHVDRSIENNMPFIHSNVLGTQVLLDVAKKYGVKKFHHISTDEVYGDVSLESDYAFTEKDTLNPRNPYSASKAGSEHLVNAYFQTHGLPVVTSRCSNNFGPHQAAEKFLPTIIRSIEHGNSIPVYGDGKNVRDWLYVEDHCRAIDTIFHNGSIGEIYNIATNNEWHNIDVVKKVLHIMNASEDLIEFVPDRPGHDKKYSIDASKIERELGWKAISSFEESLETTIAWYKKMFVAA